MHSSGGVIPHDVADTRGERVDKRKLDGGDRETKVRRLVADKDALIAEQDNMLNELRYTNNQLVVKVHQLEETLASMNKKLSDAEKQLAVATDKLDYANGRLAVAVNMAKTGDMNKLFLNRFARRHQSEALASGGNKSSIYNLSLWSWNLMNTFTKKEYAIGFRWAVEGSMAGHVSSKTQLGLFLVTGKGVQTDFEEGKKHLLDACKTGSKRAAYKLGTFFETGEYGFPIRPIRAYKFFEKVKTNKIEDLADWCVQNAEAYVAKCLSD